MFALSAMIQREWHSTNWVKSGLVIAATLMLITCLTGCDNRKEKQITVDYLLPQFRNKVVHSLAFSSGEGHTQMYRQNNEWWVAKPVDYRAEQSAIESFLRTLNDAEIGKKVQVASEDLHRLNLDKDNGLWIELNYGNNENITLVIGVLDFPDDVGATGLLGRGHSARRYVRVINEKDEVFLSPISVVDLSSANTYWTDYSLVRIPSFKQLRIKTDDEVIDTYYRETPFNQLFRRDSNGQITNPRPNLFGCFEEFLKKGYCYEVANAEVTYIPPHSTNKQKIVEVEDFLGVTYSFKFGSKKTPSEREAERAELAAGVLHDGKADTRVPFLLETSVHEKLLNVFEQKLFNENQIISQRLRERIAYIDIENAHCLLSVLETE